jgi:hypothetical protein
VEPRTALSSVDALDGDGQFVPPLEIILVGIGLRRWGVFYHTPARSRGAESMRLALDVLEGQNFAGVNYDRVRARRTPKSRPPKSRLRPTTSRRWGYFLPPRPEQGLRLTLDIFECQNLALQNHDCVRPRRGIAA